MDYREKMRKYVKPGTTLKLKAPNGIEEVFEIQPLPMRDYPEFFELLRRLDALQKSAGKDEVDMVGFMSQENVSMIVELEKKTIVRSFDLDVEKDEVLIDGFITNNFIPLFNAVIEANMVSDEESSKTKVMNRINQLKGEPVVNAGNGEDSSREKTPAIKSSQTASP